MSFPPLYYYIYLHHVQMGYVLCPGFCIYLASPSFITWIMDAIFKIDHRKGRRSSTFPVNSCRRFGCDLAQNICTWAWTFILKWTFKQSDPLYSRGNQADDETTPSVRI